MKTLKERIEVETVYLNGGSVEYKTPTEYWLPLGIPKDEMVFYWQDNDYRIKPEPLEFWVNVPDSKLINSRAFSSEKDALVAWKDSNQGYKTIKVREVLDE